MTRRESAAQDSKKSLARLLRVIYPFGNCVGAWGRGYGKDTIDEAAAGPAGYSIVPAVDCSSLRAPAEVISIGAALDALDCATGPNGALRHRGDRAFQDQQGVSIT